MSNKRIFLSYSSDNKVMAKELAALMAKRGASVFYDVGTISNDSWSETLRREIERASALVLILPSENVSNRNFIWFEAGAAKALGKRVLAVLPPNHHISNLPSDIADVFVLDADKRPLESIADTLLQAIPAEA